MRWIRLDEINQLRRHAETVYELGKNAPASEFNSEIDRLIRCLDDICKLLEEHGQQAAQERQTLAVEGLHEALRSTDAAMIQMDSVTRFYGWEYQGARRSERETHKDDSRVVGLSTLKRRFKEFMTRLRHERVRSIVRKILEERFQDEFVFEPIVVESTVDQFGDGGTYLRILVVFDGDQNKLDPGWTSGLIRRIEPRLVEAGIEEFSSVSFSEKSEWWNSYLKRQRGHWEDVVEFPSGEEPSIEGTV